MDAPAEPELASYWRQFEAVTARAEALTAALTEAQWTWRPVRAGWSVAECIDHLCVTSGRYLPRIEEMIRSARARGLTGHGPFRHPFVGNWFVRMMEPPPRRKFRVPGVFLPRSDRPVASLMPEFRRVHEQLLACVAEADGLDLAAVKTASPAARYFTLTLGQCFGALAAHDRRHLWQASQVTARADFPKG